MYVENKNRRLNRYKKKKKLIFNDDEYHKTRVFVTTVRWNIVLIKFILPVWYNDVGFEKKIKSSRLYTIVRCDYVLIPRWRSIVKSDQTHSLKFNLNVNKYAFVNRTNTKISNNIKLLPRVLYGRFVFTTSFDFENQHHCRNLIVFSEKWVHRYVNTL